MYFWYKLFTYLFYPFAPIYLNYRKLKKKEDKKSYKEKLSKITFQREEGFLIWFHVASIGEAMSVLPLIDYYIKESKIKKILITSITLSSGKVLEKKFFNNSKVIHQFLPLDVKVLTSKFLDHWKPNLSIFVDSEIWPNLITNIKKKQIPLILINARITKKSFNRWKIVKNFAKKIFSKFDLCVVSNNESEIFLKDLGVQNIRNCGNLKFSNIKNNSNKVLDTKFLHKIKNRKIWCASSTHPTEELLCAKAHLKIKENYSDILTIIIPRHINRVNKIRKDLSELNLNVILSSEMNQMDEKKDILLINSYGEALKFYNISKYVFLGKSLVKSLKEDSGQNPIEPARLGCKILHGPYISNFIEAYNYLKTLGITKKINNSDELSLLLLEEFKEDKAKNYEISTKIENYGQNILNNVIAELEKYINNFK